MRLRRKPESKASDRSLATGLPLHDVLVCFAYGGDEFGAGHRRVVDGTYLDDAHTAHRGKSALRLQQLLAGDGALLDTSAQCFADFEDNGARYAGEDSRTQWGGADVLLVHPEQIPARGLDGITAVIQQQRFVESGFIRFSAREHLYQAIA